MSGIDLIAAERARQVSQEGWTPEHDDQHTYGELVTAAMCYAIHASHQTRSRPTPGGLIDSRWPWERSWWKPSDDPVRNLEKAGALLAAEIDRLRRLSPAAGESQSVDLIPVSLSESPARATSGNHE